MEQAYNLAKPSGFVSYIVPNVWLNNTYSVVTRKFIIQNSNKLTITEPLEKVFEGITVDTIIFISEKGSYVPSSNIEIHKISHNNNYHFLSLPTEKYSDGENPISTTISNNESSIIQKIQNKGVVLSKIANVTRGIHPYRLGDYGMSAFQKGFQIQKDIDERPYHSKEFKEGYRPFIYGKDLKRFEPLITKEYVKYGNWLAEPRDSKFFEGDRVYSRKILGQKLLLTIEKGDSVADQQVYITKPINTDIKVEYIAGILGSNLMAFFIRKYYNEVNDAFPQIKVGQLKSLPIRLINPKDRLDIEKGNLIVQQVELLFDTNKELRSTKLSNKIEQLNAKIEHVEERINQLIYDLYEINEDERSIIESYQNATKALK